jgi:AraC family transcriptional regulator
MDPVQKALWFVESHSREAISLEDVAKACDVSPFHLTRAFAASTGWSLMRYVRGRRLSEAARQLARGADDILRLALDAGYGSHEAFTRAFVERFSVTPEQLRSRGHLHTLQLQESITMSASQATDLAPPRLETLEPKLLAGLVERYNCQSPAGIPDQWQRFAPYLGSIPGQVGQVAYGVCYDFDREGNFGYMSAVEVAGSPVLPKGLTTLSLAAQRCAVFTHREHIAGIRSTIAAIWSKGLPESGHKAIEAPTLERYGPEFDAKTGLGGLEIWVPVEA